EGGGEVAVLDPVELRVVQRQRAFGEERVGLGLVRGGLGCGNRHGRCVLCGGLGGDGGQRYGQRQGKWMTHVDSRSLVVNTKPSGSTAPLPMTKGRVARLRFTPAKPASRHSPGSFAHAGASDGAEYRDDRQPGLLQAGPP